MGILSELAKELQTLIEDVDRLSYDENDMDAIAWRYCRLLWQDKLQLELVLQLTRIGNAMEVRNDMVREALLAEPPREDEEEQDDPVRDDFNALAREHNRRMHYE